MPFDTPLVVRQTANGLCARLQVRNFAAAAPAQAVANDVTQSTSIGMRSIEPMLLLHREQAESFRLIGNAVSRGFKALSRLFAV